ncbi:MAG: DeoR/GlpR transcriptional regulator [Parasporobacterium sp.]|nr:DeoR/GlpR transcriptional regulator [Parasporobacterium sp.]
MLAIARKKIILQQLREHKSVQITELAEMLQVTKETIRRDLQAMEQDGHLIRTHGGAFVLEGVETSLDASTRQALRTAEKEIIAEKCSSIIQNGDYVFLDDSTTAFFIAKKLVTRKITVITNSLDIIDFLAPSSVTGVFAVGGEYDHQDHSFKGSSAARSLEQYHFDKCFISCRSVSMDAGMTDSKDDDAIIHHIALTHAHEKYLAIDNTKLNRSSFSSVAPVSILDGIIMDRPFPMDWTDFLDKNSVKYY